MEEDSAIDEDVLLRGLHTRIFNSRGTEVLLNINTEETAEDANIQIFDFNSFLTEDIAEEDFEEEEELILSQLDQYIYQSIIYNWAEEHAPRVVNNWTRSDVNVNLDDVCNAYFDGELNFLKGRRL